MVIVDRGKMNWEDRRKKKNEGYKGFKKAIPILSFISRVYTGKPFLPAAPEGP
jgi:hypothetical protein